MRSMVYSSKQKKLRKGVCYDAGRVVLGRNQRPHFNPQIAHRELEIIKNDLHCNTIRICGENIDHLISTAEDALEQDFEVWLSPELWDHNQQETLDYIATAALAAERLRKHWPERLVFSVGSELTIFMNGILKGEDFFARVGNPLTLALTMFRLKVSGSHNKPLNDFLVMANQAVRKVFRGSVTYASAPIETVDWSLFDYISVDYYRGKRNRKSYEERLKRYFAYGKPVIISEVGCCTYQGAEDKGGRAFMIVDRKNPERLGGKYVRDEWLQARELTDMLGVLVKSGVEGVFVFTFVAPTLKHNEEAMHDLDMASYSLVKSYAHEKHGTAYPDMTWEPKEAFHAVSDFYVSK
jgi:hypothetical protein